MKKFSVIAVFIMLAFPLLLSAQDEKEIGEMLLDFKSCLRRNDYQKAASYLSRDFIAALKNAAGPTPAGEGYDFLHQDPVEFIKEEVDGTCFEDFEVASIKQSGNIATAELRPKSGKLVKLFLEKEAGSGWKITLAPPNFLGKSQQQDEARIEQLDQKRHAVEWRQHLADDINADRWEGGWYWRHR